MTATLHCIPFHFAVYIQAVNMSICVCVCIYIDLDVYIYIRTYVCIDVYTCTYLRYLWQITDYDEAPNAYVPQLDELEITASAKHLKTTRIGLQKGT